MWNLEQYASHVAVVTENGTEISYRELNTAAKRLNEYMPGRRLVFCLCKNEAGSLLGYISFLNHRHVPLLLDAKLAKDLLQNLLNAYRPAYIWLPEDMAHDFTDCPSVFTDYGYCLLATEYEKAYELYDELALLLTTSGSTGSPKLVRQSYENIKSNTASIVEYLELTDRERPITTLPMSYTYGLSIINSHLYVGAAIVMTEKTLMQKDFWRQLIEFKATSFGGVPYTYEMLNRLKFFRMNLPSLTTMTQAGGKLSAELHRKFAEYAHAARKKFIVMYGQTEATARMSYLPGEKSLEKYGSMGIAIPGGKFRLMDGAGGEIKTPDVVGELVYEGKNVTLGYAQRGEDLALGDERNGVLVTGDMAKMDADGYYYIVGRKKRFLKIFGHRMNLDEMEQLIKTEFVDENWDCACAGVDDYLYIFITDGTAEKKVISFISAKTGIHPSAFTIHFVDKIPKNETGKVIYTELEKYYDTL